MFAGHMWTGLLSAPPTLRVGIYHVYPARDWNLCLWRENNSNEDEVLYAHAHAIHRYDSKYMSSLYDRVTRTAFAVPATLRVQAQIDTRVSSRVPVTFFT